MVVTDYECISLL